MGLLRCTLMFEARDLGDVALVLGSHVLLLLMKFIQQAAILLLEFYINCPLDLLMPVFELLVQHGCFTCNSLRNDR